MDTLTKEVAPTYGAAISNEVRTVTTNLIDLSTFSNIPDLDSAEIVPVDMSVEYWTPEKEGETRRCIFSHIETRHIEDDTTGEERAIPTAFFYGKKDGKVFTFCNASKRLLGVFENNKVSKGFACIITYMGKEKNATNTFSSDRWTVNPLKVTKK